MNTVTTKRFLINGLILIMFFLMATGPVYAQDAENAKDIMEKIESLEQRLKQLSDEAEARKKIQINEEEKTAKEEEILTAVDKEEYVLTREKKIDLSYTFSYGYSTYDRLQLDESDSFAEHLYNHSLEHELGISYGVLKNLSVSYSIPFVYRYYNLGSSDSKDVTDIGDMSLGAGLRPFKTSGWMPNMSFNFSASLPTGRSPYKIDPAVELSTGSGLYSVGAGVSLSKAVDPIVAFSSISYSHSFPRSKITQKVSNLVLTKVVPGDSIGVRAGIGYAMSYITSISLSFSYSYGFNSKYYYDDGTVNETAIGTSASFSIGTGWKISPATTVSVSFAIGLVSTDNFTFSVSVPFQL